MKEKFSAIDLVLAYKEIKPPALICTKGAKEGLYDITPIGWIMAMDYEPVTKVIFSCDPVHQCDANIKRSPFFAVAMPIGGEKSETVKNCGSVSDASADKFNQFGIKGMKAKKIDVMLPVFDISSWIECRLVRVIREGSVDLIIGEAVASFSKQG